MRTLVTGWFSFEEMGATAGDLLARNVACEWLEQAGHTYDVALAPPFTGGVDWRVVNPDDYANVVFVCGPIGNGKPVDALIERFRGRRLVGLDLTMLAPLEEWNPFDLLWMRDSSAGQGGAPDISFASSAEQVPVVGTILIDTQPEYGERDLRQEATDAIQRLVASREMSVVDIDTRLDRNRGGLTTPREVESLIARMDAVLTTRLHGTVLALKNGVPAVVIDAVREGDKVIHQARRLGWPAAFTADAITDDDLGRALDYCLSADGRAKAAACAEQGRAQVTRIREEFVAALHSRASPQTASRPKGGAVP
jgi:polysaccharide pyruvyl transferase